VDFTSSESKGSCACAKQRRRRAGGEEVADLVWEVQDLPNPRPTATQELEEEDEGRRLPPRSPTADGEVPRRSGSEPGEWRRSPGTKYTAAPHTEVTATANHSTGVEWVEMGTRRREEEEKNTAREEGGL
jgi:hypothetical protein